MALDLRCAGAKTEVVGAISLWSACVWASAYFDQTGIMVICPCQTITPAKDLHIRENAVA